eukprot:9475780-Pyramimonas_sp.AAC.1
MSGFVVLLTQEWGGFLCSLGCRDDCGNEENVKDIIVLITVTLVLGGQSNCCYVVSAHLLKPGSAYTDKIISMLRTICDP